MFGDSESVEVHLPQLTDGGSGNYVLGLIQSIEGVARVQAQANVLSMVEHLDLAFDANGRLSEEDRHRLDGALLEIRRSATELVN